MDNKEVEQVELKKLIIYVNHPKTKKGDTITSYRTYDDEKQKFVNVIFCREQKNEKPLQNCFAYCEKGNYNFAKDYNGYDVCFISKVSKFEPYTKE